MLPAARASSSADAADEGLQIRCGAVRFLRVPSGRTPIAVEATGSPEIVLNDIDTNFHIEHLLHNRVRVVGSSVPQARGGSGDIGFGSSVGLRES